MWHILHNEQVKYHKLGTGPAVVLLHGFGEDGTVWDNLLEAIKNYTFLVPHLPGTGASEAAALSDIDGMAGVVHRILLQEGIAKATVLGHSMGGYIALAFAEKYSAHLTALGLIHSTAFADNDEKKETRKKGIRFIQEHGAAAFLETTIPNLFSPYTKERNPHLMEPLLHSAAGFSDAALIHYYEAMMQRPDRTGVLKKMQIPVLLLLGRHDTAVPLADGLKLAPMAALTAVHVLENSAHMGMLEEKEETKKIIANFLGQIPQFSSPPQ